jgi:glycosyltransferase involved in cell wall biosynthesis
VAAAQPDISVVIGAQNAQHTIVECIRQVLGTAAGPRAEVIVADGSTDGTADLVSRHFPGVVLIRGRSQQLVPQLWGLGIQRASAPLVAIINAQCIPADDWLASIARLAAEHPDMAGVGGPIEAPEHDGAAIDWAVYFTRYSAYMPPITAGPAAEIPGDNAVYRKAMLDRYWVDRDQGFWETLFHRQLHSAGERLYMSPDMRVRLGRTGGAGQFARARFRHGQHYGATRPVSSLPMRILRVVAAPVLMPLLQARIGRRVMRQRRDLLRSYLWALPWSTAFLSSWSCGEVSGYLAPART